MPGRLALVDCVADAAARRQWTYAEFVAAAEQAARALLARFEPGERIAIWAPNSAEWVILQQAISLAGMVLVALNPAYRTREMQFVLEQSGAAGLFCADAYRGFDMLGMAQAIRPSLPELREIEAALQDHPAIETAAVIGVPDEKWGEQVAAVLRLRADFARPTAAELSEFLRDQIAPHKIPVFWSFVDGLPMTPTGKTQKYVLRQQAADGALTFDEARPSKSVTPL